MLTSWPLVSLRSRSFSPQQPYNPTPLPMPTPSTLTRVLDCLSIVHGQLDVESAKALSRALERNASLTRLNLDGLELDLDHLRGVGDEPPAHLDFSYQGITRKYI